MYAKLQRVMLGAGLAVSLCLPAHALLITEIHADPDSSIAGDANKDGISNYRQDEFIELVNTSSVAINLTAWSITDAVTTRHIFTTDTILAAGQTLLLFGGGDPIGDFFGALVGTASSGSLGLNNAGDTVAIYNEALELVTSYSYGIEAGDNQSITRAIATPIAPLLQHASFSPSSPHHSAGYDISMPMKLSPNFMAIPTPATLSLMLSAIPIFWRRLR